MIVTTSWDDGHVLDMRLADMLADTGVRATFYIALENHELEPSERLPVRQLRQLAEHFEVGSHTLTHPTLTRIPLAAAAHEMVASRAALSDVVGRPVDTFCYPRGACSGRLAALARESGYVYGRTVTGFELGMPVDRWRAGVALEAARPGVHQWLGAAVQTAAAGAATPATLADWEARAIALFERARRRDGVFHLWGHSWVIERRGQWDRLARVLRHIAQTPHIEMLTNGELAWRLSEQDIR